MFTSRWTLPTTTERAYNVLRDLVSYPTWWPNVVDARADGDDRVAMALRSALPMTLRYTLARDTEDEANGLLRAQVTGHIRGTVEWRIVTDGQGHTQADFKQDVLLEHPIAKHVNLPLRRLLEWNHGHAMRQGQADLTAHLAGATH